MGQAQIFHFFSKTDANCKLYEQTSVNTKQLQVMNIFFQSLNSRDFLFSFDIWLHHDR